MDRLFFHLLHHRQVQSLTSDYSSDYPRLYFKQSQSALTNKCPVCKDDTRLHLLACRNRYCVERDGTRCEGCSRSKIEACCTICLKLLCFRCGVVQKECKTSNKKHDIEPIEEVLEEGQTRVKQWIESTNIKYWRCAIRERCIDICKRINLSNSLRNKYEYL